MKKADKKLFVHAFGTWMSKDSLPSERKAAAHQKRKWFSRSRKEGGKTW